jgi:tetratricopeptide (TPR) repeat protein
MTVAADIDDRIAKCQKILEGDPNSQIFAALAEAHRKKGELDRAFRICQNGLKIHPSYGSAHVVMAKINMDRGMFDWAEAEVNKAVEIDGNSRGIELLLAEIHIYKGEFASAIRLLKKLHAADPNNSQIKKLLDIARRIPEEQKLMMDADRREEASQPESGDSGEAPAEPARQPLTPGELLREALQMEHLDGALYINSEGLVVESEWTLEMDAGTCGATLAEVSNVLSKELVRAQFGKAGSLLIEANEAVFYIVRMDHGMFVFVGDKQLNLGGLRMRIAALIDNVEINGSGH